MRIGQCADLGSALYTITTVSPSLSLSLSLSGAPLHCLACLALPRQRGVHIDELDRRQRLAAIEGMLTEARDTNGHLDRHKRDAVTEGLRTEVREAGGHLDRRQRGARSEGALTGVPCSLLLKSV